MDKEKLITIGIGLLVGIASATIYFFLSRYLVTWQQSQAKVTFSPTSNQPSQGNQPTPNNQLAVTINQPDDHSSTVTSPISVSGKTQPGVKLVVFANADEKVASAGGNGNFKIDVKLEDGENEISITAIDNQGNLVTAKRNITLEIVP